MIATDLVSPFHQGERAAQERAGVGGVAKSAGGFIRDYLPEQHRDFHTALPFLVISAGDAAGRRWITLIEGPDGYATSPDPRHLHLATGLDAADPLAQAVQTGTDIGVLGIELASARRNRFSGHIKPNGAGLAIDIHQTFGNCPQYIHQRAWRRVKTTPGPALHSAALSTEQMTLINGSDTMFIGSGHHGAAGALSNGYDASHRGGTPGFVRVVNDKHLKIPDYAGNNFFNTIGNIHCDPRIGLLFIDFETGGLLHVSGRATVDWNPENSHDSGARRMINVDIEAVIDRPAAVSLRWAKQDAMSRWLKVEKRVKESADITSFYLTAVDGRPLDTFQAGQHLTVEVQIPGQKGTSKRSYSLSGSPADDRFHRISVKREGNGLVSQFLHDQLHEGSLIKAQKPAGDFVIPCSNCPLVLVSAGVGLTPMISVLHSVAADGRPVWFVHGVRSSSDHAMRDEVAALVLANPAAEQIIAYSRPQDGDIKGRDYHASGRVTAAMLHDLNAGPHAHYMLCGPTSFLADIQNGLEARGVTPERIHFEVFGPTGSNVT